MRITKLYTVQREMYYAHKRGAWDTVIWLAEKSLKLRRRYYGKQSKVEQFNPNLIQR